MSSVLIVLIAKSFSKPRLPRRRASHTVAIPPDAIGHSSSYRSSRYPGTSACSILQRELYRSGRVAAVLNARSPMCFALGLQGNVDAAVRAPAVFVLPLRIELAARRLRHL